LEELGIYVKKDWYEECLEYIKSEVSDISKEKLKDLIIDQFLLSDLRDIGRSSIKETIKKMHNEKLKGNK
jgi:hypothetical protein